MNPGSALSLLGAAAAILLCSAPADAAVLAGGTLTGPTGVASAGAVRVYA